MVSAYPFEGMKREHEAAHMRSQSDVRIFFALFVISGFCGLIYEVVWLRLAMASFGVTTALASIVISMFMAGLGLGSWAAGKFVSSKRLAKNGLTLYALAELCVCISAFSVPLELKLGRTLLQHATGAALWQSSGYYLAAGVWLAITIVPWCTCMGATFPLLMSAVGRERQENSKRSFSYLYLGNVFGALIGTAASAFILVELLGFQRTLYIAGLGNAIVATCAFRLSPRSSATPEQTETTNQPIGREKDELYGLSSNFTLFTLFSTGFVSMGLEVVWIRQYTPYLGNVVYAFAGILIVYLIATVFGTLDYRAWVQSHAPGESAGSWSLLGLFAMIPVLAADPLMPFRVGNTELGGVRLSFIVLFCALCGFLTPLLVDSFSSGDPRRAGVGYAVNILGSILGPLVAAFFLLPKVGERRSVAVFSLLLFVCAAAIVFGKCFTGLKVKFWLSLLGACTVFAFSHDYENKYAQKEIRRDYAATVIATGRGFDRELLVNGVGMTKLVPDTKYMVHLPLAFLPYKPQNGLVICFGMGTSVRSMLSWDIPVTAVDLIPSVPAVFPYYHADAQKVLRDPHLGIVIDDGRRFLDGSSEIYDVIVIDPPPPTAAPGSSLLYSTDFYQVIKRHLRRRGILQMWYPAATGDDATAASVAKSLQQSFVYVRPMLSYNRFGIHFLASESELADESSRTLAERLPPAAVKDFLEWGPAATAEEQFEKVLSQKLTMGQILAADYRVPVISDDQPINEYYLLRSWSHFYR